MVRHPFNVTLNAAWTTQDSFLCCGLDPQLKHLPEAIPRTAAGLLLFCQQLADAVAAHVCAFKPQAAHFAAAGAEAQLAELIRWLHEHHPALPVILDAKRGDIGSTAELYAQEAFERYDADAVTVNPFLGPETLAPFLQRKDRGVIVLCRTSNPDSDWLQGLGGDDPVFLRIARAARDWNQHGNVALVTGATHPEELRQVRLAAPELPLLVPGVGAQGGDAAAVLAAGRNSAGMGLIVNVSRGISQASTGPDYLQAATRAARQFHDQLRPSGARSRAEPAT